MPVDRSKKEIARRGRSRPFAANDTSAVRRAADQLREIILSRPVGAYLGSQEALLKLLGIGKVTLHQTARILEHEALLEVKRGVHGGYFRARPDIDLVKRAASIYLHSKEVRPADYQSIARAVSAELMRQAVTSTNESAWQKLEKLERRVTNPTCLADSMLNNEAISEFFDILYELAANPLGEMILRVNARLSSVEPASDALANDKAKWQYHKLRLQMVRALLDRDGEYADLLAKRLFVFLEDQSQRSNQRETLPHKA